ncbi:L,D-transpeptidase family protein [Desertihabitans brevis]|nr:L,D-transpeptidase family protein [Desertihabitans brevis]
MLVLLATVLVLGISLSSATSAQARGRDLQYGMSGGDVSQLRVALDRNKRADYLAGGSAGRKFDSATKDGLKRWQKAAGYQADGRITVGTKEWQKLRSEQGPARPAPKPKPKGPSVPAACKVKGRVLCASKKDDKLRYYENGSLKMTIDARFGCASDRTREGTFTVFRKVRNDWSYLYDTPMKFSMYFSGGQAVHYSYDFKARGYNGCSHGCVNTRDWSRTEQLFAKIRVGDRVVVHR